MGANLKRNLPPGAKARPLFRADERKRRVHNDPPGICDNKTNDYILQDVFPLIKHFGVVSAKHKIYSSHNNHDGSEQGHHGKSVILWRREKKEIDDRDDEPEKISESACGLWRAV